MPYYEDDNLLFIHIPRTGGSSLENYLKGKYKQTLHGFASWPIRGNGLLPGEDGKSSFQHLTYNSIYKYRDILKVNFNDNLKVISIVRNPYDRIISDLIHIFPKRHIMAFRPNNYIRSNKTLLHNRFQMRFRHEVIEEYLYKDLYSIKQHHGIDNHNIPQYKFLTDENENIIPGVKIFRTESLTRELKEYGFIEYEGKDTKYTYSDYLSEDSIELITKFYKKDFELFNYFQKSEKK